VTRIAFGWLLTGGAAALAVAAGCRTAAPPLATTGGTPAAASRPDALALHRRSLVLDTHIDTTQRLYFEPAFDIGARHPNGHLDIPRMREGGLDAAFFSIWMPGTITGPAAVRRALALIAATRDAVRLHADDLVLATTVSEIERAAASGRIAILLGMEGGHMIDNDLGLLRAFAALGVRYLTLTHSRNTDWADSSGDDRRHGGLTGFGREVVRELNRLGVMVDVSHVSDETFADALEASRAPLIASHSSMRAISNHPRNMTDDMVRAMAAAGGIVMINYHAPFLNDAYRAGALAPEIAAEVHRVNQQCGDDEACAIMGVDELNRGLMRNGRLPAASIDDIVAHIERAVKVAGIDHVGLGSDFDGATMPLGMEDVSRLPQLTSALLVHGFSAGDVEKILGTNFLRVMSRVEAAADARP
jgi:membrane dipeptidase